MPGFVTHYLFGVDAYKRIPFTSYKRNLFVNHSAYALGLQGPDLFFYYFPSYFMHYDNMGAIAHENQTEAFFTYLVESRTLFTGNKYETDIADAYICGFMGHYALDCSCHPYVFARTGYDPKNKQPQSVYFGQHAYLETELDNTLLYMKKHLLPTEFHQHRTICLTPVQADVIARMLVYSYRHAFPDLMVNTTIMKQAFVCMKTGTRLLNDPSGQKKALVRGIEKVFNGKAMKGRPFISPMVPSDCEFFVADPLNNAHHPWQHPWTKDETNASFLDLYQEASLVIDERLQEYFMLIANNFPPADVASFCMKHGNRSFLSGLPL